MLSWLANIRKTIASVVGITVTILSVANVIPGPWHVEIGVILGALTALSVYLVPNKTTAAKGV